jgi:hypothetical protein
MFAQWAVVYFGQLLKIYRNSPQFLATFYQSKDVVFIFTHKMVWATFWAIFLLAHLVTHDTDLEVTRTERFAKLSNN